MKDNIKIRIRPSAVVRGSWYACFVKDKPRDRFGVTQIPVEEYIGVRGKTPKEAYTRLRGRM